MLGIDAESDGKGGSASSPDQKCFISLSNSHLCSAYSRLRNIKTSNDVVPRVKVEGHLWSAKPFNVMQFGGLGDREYFSNHQEQQWKEHSVKPQGGELRVLHAEWLSFKRMYSTDFIYFPLRVPMVTHWDHRTGQKPI